MATRQRAPSSRKAPVISVAASSIDSASLESAAADVPGVEQTVDNDVAPQVSFVGEQLVYKSREERIAESAYLYAQVRNFEPGHEVEDWLRAEKEVDALLASSAQQSH